MTKRKGFSGEFKRQAVRLLETSQKPPSDLARELGVRRNQLYKWKEQMSKRGREITGSDFYDSTISFSRSTCRLAVSFVCTRSLSRASKVASVAMSLPK